MRLTPDLARDFMSLALVAKIREEVRDIVRGSTDDKAAFDLEEPVPIMPDFFESTEDSDSD